MYSMPYFFFKNFKNQDLWDEIFKIAEFQYFAMIFD